MKRNSLLTGAAEVSGLIQSVLLLAVALAALLPAVARADAPALRLAIAPPGISNEFSATPVLEWAAVPGVTYTVEAATNLDLGAFTAVDAVASETGPIKWMAPESLSGQRFYRVTTRSAIRDVQPAFVDSGDPDAALYILGQLLPTNALVLINDHWLQATQDASGALMVSLNGLPPGEPVLGTLTVMDSTSNVVATLPVESPILYGPAMSDEILQGPPTEPPTSPMALIAAYASKRGYDYYKAASDAAGVAIFASKKGYDYYQAQSALASTGLHNNPAFQENQNAGEMPDAGGRYLSKKGYDYWKARSDLSSSGTHNNPAFQENQNAGEMAGVMPPDNGKGINQPGIKRSAGGIAGGVIAGIVVAAVARSGELQAEATDLAIPGVGLDFAWTRTYRSRTGPATAQGAGWDFSYNVSLAQNGDGTLTLRPGNGRADTFYPTGTNWVRAEYFCEIRDLDQDGRMDVLFADTGRWVFNPFNSKDPAGGKLAQIIDRNGNTITLNYDVAGRLVEIIDTLGRTNTVAFDPAGRVASVTDFTGRRVHYEYSAEGDLASVISPPTTEFPGGITNRYTYSSGHPPALERLNHNLTSCLDGQGQTQLEIVYSQTNDPASGEFDTVISTQRGVEKKDIRRGFLAPRADNGFATTKVIVRDALGNVTEEFYDSRGRCVRLLEYTGRAPDLNAPTTETQNRPVNKLRAEDPDYFETRWTWNRDSLCTSETLPDGAQARFVHRQEFGPVRPQKKGDLQVVRVLASPGSGADLDGDGAPDISELVWHFDYDPRFGSPASRVMIHKIHRGERLHVDGRLIVGDTAAASKSSVQDHNSSRSNKSASRSSVQDHNSSRSNKSSSLADFDGDHTPIIQGSALKRFGIGDASPDSPLGLLSSARSGNVGINEPIPHTVLHNLRARIEQLEARLQGLGLLGVTRVTDPRGGVITAEYDPQGNCTRSIRHGHYAVSNFHIEVDYVHNSSGQLTAITNAPDANGYTRVDTIRYYSSGPQSGQVQSIAIDESGVHLTSSFEYDARGNLTRYVDPLANDWLFTCDALDRLVERQTPDTSFGARTATHFTYDANGNLLSSSTELRDETGTFIRNVVTRAEYDSHDRCVALAEQVAPGVFLTNRFDYDANDNLVAVHSPRAVSGADPHAAAQFEYDERGLLFREIGAAGSGNSPTNEYSYNVNGLRTRINELEAKLQTIGLLSYDGFSRPVSYTDPMGNETRFTCDANGNCTLVRCYGELADAPGGAKNRLLAQTRCTYDALDRCVQQADSFFDYSTVAGQPLGDGYRTTTFAYAPNGACTSVTDDNGHATSFSYDTAGRVYAVRVPNNKSLTTVARDAAGRITRVTQTDTPDAGGAQVFTLDYAYDSLGRCVADWDNVGNTNSYAYDSLGRCVRATDPKGTASWAAYDDLGRCTLSIGDLDGDGAPDLAHDVATACAYDDNSRCVAATDANTNITRYAYDSLGNCTTVTNADGTTLKLIWSPRSNLLSTEDANGTTITNTYDLCERIIHRDIAARGAAATTTTFESFSYDGLSRCVSASNDASTSSFAYDSLGHLASFTQDGLTTACTHDAVGNRLSMTYPGGRVVTCTYNEVDDLSTMSSSAGGGLPPTTLASYSYAGPGRLARVTRPNGIHTTLQWDGTVNPPNASDDHGWMQVRGVSHAATGFTPVDQRRSSFDPNQNRTARAQLAPALASGLETNLFGYDACDRLTYCFRLRASDSSSLELSLDRLGNRLAETNGTFIGLYTMESTLPPGDFQMARYSTTPFGMEAHDATGNLHASGDAMSPTLYAYDYANRLVQVSAMSNGSPSVLASYAYDALGRRVSRTATPAGSTLPVTTQFIRGTEECDDGNVIEERVGGVVARTFAMPHVFETKHGAARAFAAPHVFEPKGRVMFSGTGDPYYLHTDDLDNLLAVTDAAGAVLERYSYDAFGAPTFLSADGMPKTGPDGVTLAKVSDFGMSRLFRGMEWDDATGLYQGSAAAKGGIQSNPLYDQDDTGTNPLFDYDARTGHVLSPLSGSAGGATSPYDPFAGNPWKLKKEEGGRHTPFHNKYKPAATSGGRRKEFTGHVTLIK